MRPDPDYFEETGLGKPYDVRLLRRLTPFVRPHGSLLLWSIGLVVLITLLDVILPYVTKLAIDRHIVPFASEAAVGDRRLKLDVSDPAARAVLQRHPDLAQVEGAVAYIPYEALAPLGREELARLRRADLAGLALIAGIFGVLVIFDFLLNFAQSVIMEITGQRIMHELRMRLFSHTQELTLEFFTRNPVGRLVTRTTSDIQNMYELFTSFISFVFKDLVLLAGIAAVMLVLNWKLALVSFIVLPVVAVASVRFSKRARHIFRTLRVQVAEINTRFAETIGGMRVIQLYRREADNFHRFAGLNHANYLSGMEQIRVLAVFMPLIEVVALTAVALIIWYGGGQVMRRCAEPGGPGGLHLLHPHVLPAPAGPRGKIQHPAERHGLGRAHLPGPGHAHRAAPADGPPGRKPPRAARHRGAALRACDLRLCGGGTRAERRLLRDAPG